MINPSPDFSYRLATANGGSDAIAFRPLSLALDAARLHEWVNHDSAAFWGMQGSSPTAVLESYERALRKPGVTLWMGMLASSGEPMFLLECYDPKLDGLSQYYRAQPGDAGIHIFVSPHRPAIPSLAYHVFRAFSAFVFSDPEVMRIVAEPDIRNAKALKRFIQAGYRLGKVVHLPYKTAILVALSRAETDQVGHHDAPAQIGRPLDDAYVRRHVFIGKVFRKCRKWMARLKH